MSFGDFKPSSCACAQVPRCWRFHVFRFFGAGFDSAWLEEDDDGVETELEEEWGGLRLLRKHGLVATLLAVAATAFHAVVNDGQRRAVFHD